MTSPGTAGAFRHLDEAQVLRTIARLRDRIAERFPGSGLSGVAAALLALGEGTAARVERLRRPRWPLRIVGGVAVLALSGLFLGVFAAFGLPVGVEGVADLVQSTEAALNALFLLGAAVFFLATLETRLKRREALEALHQLRSVAHIVDMHQLTKDPDRLTFPQADTRSSPRRGLTVPELGRYLDYCSELLSLVSKLAALHAEHLNDPVVLAAVNDLESLTEGLSAKIWQKITLLDRDAP
jgi:hypothetical protein